MFSISLNRVHDKIKIKEGNETLVLRVDADPMKIAGDMRNAAVKLQDAENMTPEERDQATADLAIAIFGNEQAYELKQFYNNDFSCVMAVLSQYIERLTKIITKAQKRL